MAPQPHLPPLPMPLETWEKMRSDLQLSPRHEQIVELILRNQSDKEIAVAMGLKIPTIRTYKTRMFQRLRVADRIDLILRLFAISHGIDPHRRR
jgi:DNA-binding CsgD family transcriptional regulator